MSTPTPSMWYSEPQDSSCATYSYFRKPLFSPDGTHLLVSYEDRWVRIFDLAKQTAGVMCPQTATKIELASAPIDIKFCPFMEGTDNACIVTSCGRTPIQMWDITDAELRASFIAKGDMDEYLTAQSLYWAQSGWDLVAGYRGGEMRIFDVTRPGNDSKTRYRSKVSDNGSGGIISCIGYTTQYQLHILGNYNRSIELYDKRQGTGTAGVLRGHRGGVCQVVGDIGVGNLQHHILSSARGSDDNIYLWDIRLPRLPVVSFTRKARTNQPLQFCIDVQDSVLLTGSDDQQAHSFALPNAGSSIASYSPEYFAGVFEEKSGVGKKFLFHNQSIPKPLPSFSTQLPCNVTGFAFAESRVAGSKTAMLAITTGSRTFHIQDQAFLNQSNPKAKRIRLETAKGSTGSTIPDEWSDDNEQPNQTAVSPDPWQVPSSVMVLPASNFLPRKI